LTILAVISIVSLLGWLILAGSELRSQRVSGPRMLKLALLWIAIFAGAFAVFDMMR
jgi:hypothetical protein